MPTGHPKGGALADTNLKPLVAVDTTEAAGAGVVRRAVNAPEAKAGHVDWCRSTPAVVRNLKHSRKILLDCLDCVLSRLVVTVVVTCGFTRRVALRILGLALLQTNCFAVVESCVLALTKPLRLAHFESSVITVCIRYAVRDKAR